MWAAVDGNIAWRHPATGLWQEVETAPLHTRARVRITSLTGEGSGSIWGSTEGSGFFRLVAHAVNGTLTPRYDLVQQSINHGVTSFIHSLAIDAAGTLWMGTVSGVFRSDREMWGREVRAPAGGPINEIQAMLADDDGNLWIGTRGAGIRLKVTGKALEDVELLYRQEDGLPSPYITDIAADDKGGIWAGTWQGIALLKPGAKGWSQPVAVDRLPSSHVTAVLARQGQLWIGTGNGLARYDAGTGAVQAEVALAQQFVQDLALDSNQRLWVATDGAGIFTEDGLGNWTHYGGDSESKPALPGNSVAALAPDPKVPGAMWAAVNGQGLSYFDGTWLARLRGDGPPAQQTVLRALRRPRRRVALDRQRGRRYPLRRSHLGDAYCRIGPARPLQSTRLLEWGTASTGSAAARV